MRALLVVALTLVGLRSLHANIAASVDAGNLRLLWEDVRVNLAPTYATVLGTFEFDNQIIRETVGDLEKGARFVRLRIPVVVQRGDYRDRRELFAMEVRCADVKYPVSEIRGTFPLIDLPEGAEVVVFGCSVPRYPTNGRLIVSFEYRQSYISEYFHYIPVIGKFEGAAFNVREPRNSNLRILIRSEKETPVLSGNGLDAIREEAAWVVFPKHLQVITAKKPKG